MKLELRTWDHYCNWWCELETFGTGFSESLEVLECYEKNLMGDSGQILEYQNTDRNVNSKIKPWRFQLGTRTLKDLITQDSFTSNQSSSYLEAFAAMI